LGALLATPVAVAARFLGYVDARTARRAGTSSCASWPGSSGTRGAEAGGMNALVALLLLAAAANRLRVPSGIA
jgi:hypothetical protein